MIEGPFWMRDIVEALALQAVQQAAEAAHLSSPSNREEEEARRSSTTSFHKRMEEALSPISPWIHKFLGSITGM